MKAKWIATCFLVLFVGASAAPVSAAALFDADITPDAIFGTGNANGLFTVDQSAGVELGIRAKIPFTGTIHSNGDGTYSYSLAELLAASGDQRWNFDWTVNTDWDGSTGLKIDDLTYLLQIDFDPSQGANFASFDPITPTIAVPFFDHSIGTNATANGGGTEATDGASYLTLIAGNNVCQQSWRHAFFPIHPDLVYDPTIDGTYDIVLSAFTGGSTLVASTSIQVIIGAGGAATTVENLDTGERFTTIQAAIDDTDTLAGHTISVDSGTHVQPGQVVVSKSLTLTGDSVNRPTIMTDQDTASSGDARGWFLVNAGVVLDVENLVFDGTGFKVWQAFRQRGSGSFTNCAFREIKFDESGPSYSGVAIAAFGTGPVHATDTTFDEIGRIGILYFGTGPSGSIYTKCTYTGKGVGNWLDYALDISAGITVTVVDSTVTECRGVAASDGSTSAGYLVSTFFAAGTAATFTGNFVNANTIGIVSGFDSADTSTTVATGNDLSGNDSHAFSNSSATTTVDASANWLGTTTPAGAAAAITGTIDYTPWLDVGTDTDLIAAGFQGDLSTLNVDDDSPQTGATSRIQEAVDLVTASTVNVAAGTYTETVLIDKELTLQGAGSGSTIIDASAESYGILVSAGGTSAAQRLSIRDLSITGALQNGIRAFKTGGFNFHYVTLDGVVITGSISAGFEMHNDVNVQDLKVLNCEFANNGGVGMRTSSTTPVDGVLVENSKFNGNTYGIYFTMETVNVTVRTSTMNGNSQRGYWGSNGRVSNLLIEDCEANGNSQRGITFWSYDPVNGIDGATIRRTSMDSNGFRGFHIGAATDFSETVATTVANVLLEYCTLRGNGDMGFHVDLGLLSNVEIHSCDISGNTNFGIRHTNFPISSGTVDASGNWWGDADGPEDSTGTTEIDLLSCSGVVLSDRLNADPAGGLGDPVSEDVEYCAWLGAPATLSLLADDTSCYFIGDTITVDVTLTDTTTEIVGGQFHFSYDNVALDFIAAVSGDAPFVQELLVFADEPLGEIDYAVGVTPGSAGTTADTVMARITFQAIAEVCGSAGSLVTFRTGSPPTTLSDAGGGAVNPALNDLNIISVDQSAPLIFCPSDVTVECDESTDPSNTGMLLYDQGFETGIDGWFDTGGTITQVPSGTSGITSAGGSFHAEVVVGPSNGDGAFTRFGNYSSVYPAGGFSQFIDVYIDTTTAAAQVGKGWALDNAISTNTGGWAEAGGVGAIAATDGFWWVAADADGGGYLGSAAGGLGLQITATGWYTIESAWPPNGDGLNVDRNTFIYDSSGTLLYSDLNPAQVSLAVAGGNRYGWFLDANGPDWPAITIPLAIDNSKLTGVNKALDNCDQDPTISFSDVEVAGVCSQEKTITRTWMAVDDCGNVATCDQIITVEDSTSPVVFCPLDTTVECDESTAPSNTGETGYAQGFESDLDGWFDFGGTMTRVTSGTGGVTSAAGGWHTEVTGSFTRWGGYNSVFPVGGYTTSAEIYLDVSLGLANDTRMDYSSAINDTTGVHRRDFIYSAGFYNSADIDGPGAGTDRFIMNFSNNAPGNPKNVAFDPFAIGVTGWYTIEHRFYDAGAGVLAVDLNVYDAAGTLLHTWTLSEPTDIIGSTVGGNRYGWFLNVGWTLLVDNTVMTGGPAAIDNCDASPTVTFSDVEVVGCPQESTITRTWSAEDECGNVSTCDQTITVEDTTAPVISACPADIIVNADAGGCDAMVVFAEPTATDNCDGAPSVACDSPSGTVFAAGTTLVTCTATDACGNSSDCSFNVTVNPVNELLIDVELAGGIATGPFTRCIIVELSDCAGPVPGLIVNETMTFNSGLASVTLEVACGLYNCATARDDLHTLRRTDNAFGIVGTQYVADFTSAAGEALISGNFNADPFVDILDFGVFNSQFGASFGSGDTTCVTPGPHSDVNGDGFNDNVEFAFLLANFFEESEPNCCGVLAAAGPAAQGPVERISVVELNKLGLSDLAVGDLNGDGWLDSEDIEAFANGARPVVSPVNERPMNPKSQRDQNR